MKYNRWGECNLCGDCCNRNISASPYTTPNTEVEVTEDGWCVHIDTETKKCMINDTKPRICKDWPFTPKDLILYPRCGYWFEVSY